MSLALVPAVNNIDAVYAQAFSGPSIIVGLVLYVLVVVALWKVFTKAGHPGILAIIPLVNLIFLVKIAGYSGWLVLLYLIPIVNVVFAILVAIKLGANFGKGAVSSFFLLWLIPIIGYFVIGFGDAKYQKQA
ncbi:DUF5684 domain-containing protein [Microbacterium sp. NIBRBAC000506063]|uniref:DUF5684 domain-containing protein n=1 Tax=Microbacterium sp. NIBRBAC000506063 TaxID=2734618 RepID=UPI001BB59816|nr:DUF5684 domain-containing protein [Microbacterium sp. NIBRBAC000506063]QTV80107.1 hypothetical protein KAE78_03200 [Microbacterium sp. NIBRBAC000506063]